MKKVLLVLLDGLADRRWPTLGGRTPLEAAKTPHLDRLASIGLTGLMHPLGRGLAPSSELAHFAIFGYQMNAYPGRGVFEAAGHGIPLEERDVVVHALFSSAELREGHLIVGERPANASDEECHALIASFNRYTEEGLSLKAKFVGKSQAILTIRGGASPSITDSDPYYLKRPVSKVLPVKTAEDWEAAERTAAFLNAYIGHAYRAMSSHKVNIERVRTGRLPVNVILTKWPGRKRAIPGFEERNGFKAVSVCSYPLYKGLVKELGMDCVEVPTKSVLEEDVVARLEAAERALGEGYEFVHVHVKATDDAGHEKDPGLKKRVIEEIDRALEHLFDSSIISRDVLLVVTGDHATPSGTDLLHSGDPVPVLMVGENAWRDGVESFGETACSSGGLGQFTGFDFMPIVLNLTDRVRYLGASLTQEPAAHIPRSVPPFRLDD